MCACVMPLLSSENSQNSKRGCGLAVPDVRGLGAVGWSQGLRRFPEPLAPGSVAVVGIDGEAAAVREVGIEVHVTDEGVAALADRERSGVEGYARRIKVPAVVRAARRPR